MQRDSQKEILASLTLTATTDSGAFTPAVAVEIISWGFIITTALSGTPGAFGLDKRITAGSDTGRVASTFGVITLTAAEVTAGVAGFVVRCRPSPGATGEQKLVLFPGQQAILKTNTAMGSAGVALPFIEYKISDSKQQLTAASNLTLFGVSAVVGLGNEIEQDS